MTRFVFDLSDADLSESSDGADGLVDADELEYSDEEDEENDVGAASPRQPTSPAKPSTPPTSTSRYGVDPRHPTESIESYMRRSNYRMPWQQREDSQVWSPDFVPPVQQYPPLSSYVDPNTASTQTLLEWARDVDRQRKRRHPRSHERRRRYTNERDDDENWYDREVADLQQILRQSSETAAARIVAASSSPSDALTIRQSAAIVVVPSPSQVQATEEAIQLYRGIREDDAKVQREIEHIRTSLRDDNQKRQQGLRVILKREEEKARQIMKEQKLLDAKYEEDLQEQERQKEALRAVETKRQEEELKAREAQEKVSQEKAARERAVAEAEAKERQYIVRAQQLVKELKKVQESVEPFEQSTSPHVKKRRLQTKKLVGGRINTLTENADKIRTVAAEVSKAIATARAEDDQIKQQVQAGSTEFSSEMARGKRYLVDQLCRKVIVRVQAEGFNGQRGDGFPLANMLAIVSVDNKDLLQMLAAHIYTVCPTAIPSLPKLAPNATEEELMESLGMLKNAKTGEYETFERFLTRTEVSIDDEYPVATCLRFVFF